MRSTHSGNFGFNLSAAATKAHTFENAQNSLTSVGQVCDDNCMIIFDKKKAYAIKNSPTILDAIKKEESIFTATRNSKNLLYAIDQPNIPTSEIPSNLPNESIAYECHAVLPTSTKADTMAFLQAALFSPVKSTLLKAAENGHFTSWPGMTPENIKIYFKATIASAKGHLDQSRKNQASTKTANSEEPWAATPAIKDGVRTNHVYATYLEVDKLKGEIHTDLTGRFPVTSSRGNKYIFVLYDYDSNAILVEPLQNRSGLSIVNAYTNLLDRLKKAGLKPKLQKLDNEASQALRDYMHEQDIDFQLAPPHCHRRNAAERAIRTYKNHLIAGLATTDPEFPLRLWCRLLRQSEITLNLLRPSRINPKLSAYAQIEGNFDFNRTPLAPPGTRVVAHEKPGQRDTWDAHGVDGWYVGPAMLHYRCWEIYIISTNADRICDTVAFFPKNVSMPHLSSTDAAMHAAKDLAHALLNPAPAAPFATLSTARLEAIKQLSDIFSEATTQEPPAPRQRVVPANCNVPPVAPQPRVVAPAAPQQRVAEPAAPQQRVANHRYPLRNANLISHEAVAFLTAHAKDESTQPLTTSAHSTIPIDYLANNVIHPKDGHAMNYKELISNPDTKDDWQVSATNEFARLFQGLKGGAKGTNTCFFIPFDKKPKHKKATYARFVCSVRPQKKEPNRTRMTVGGNLIEYDGDVYTRTAGMTTSKLLWNSIISTKGARCMCMDIKNFYLGTPLPAGQEEYIRIPLELIPEAIINEYNLRPLVHHGAVYVEIRRGMYGLPQSGLLANKQLAKFLAKDGYYQTAHTPGLWRHTTRPIQFSLVVDDFCVEYVGKEHALHLEAALNRHFEEVATDWEATLFCGISLKWDYENRTVDLSMPGYIDAMLHRFQHTSPTKPQFSPHPHRAIQYGAKQQMTEPDDTSVRLDDDGIRRTQRIVGTALYYARAVDPTMLVTLSALSSEQANATENTAIRLTQFLDYCATNRNATIRFKASDMRLKAHADASYLSEPKARSRAGAHFYLGNNDNASNPKMFNGPLLNLATIIKHVMASAAEAEIAALFANCKEAESLRITLEEMGYKQGATPVETDNTTAAAIVNETCKQIRSKAIDMRFYWVRDRIKQGHFIVYWAPGATNKADYFTKHHPPAHHRHVRFDYLHRSDRYRLPDPTRPDTKISQETDVPRGCVELSNEVPHSTRLLRAIESLTKSHLACPRLFPQLTALTQSLAIYRRFGRSPSRAAHHLL